MIVTALMLDDGIWIDDMKIAIEGLEESFFKPLRTKIVQIKILKVTDPEKVIEEIKKNNPDIFLIDIELGTTQQGHEIYEDLFVKNIHIKSIAVSAVVNTEGFEQEIREKGISSIVHKLKGEGPIEERIAKEICRVMESPETEFDQAMSAVERYQIQDNRISVNGNARTISEFAQEVINNPKDLENKKIFLMQSM